MKKVSPWVVVGVLVSIAVDVEIGTLYYLLLGAVFGVFFLKIPFDPQSSLRVKFYEMLMCSIYWPGVILLGVDQATR
jgi:hypothetical protein